MRLPLLFAVLLVSSTGLLACERDLRLTLEFQEVAGLTEADPVVWEENTIGAVDEVRYTRAGQFEVDVRVTPEFRAAVTDRCRFLVDAAPAGSGKAVAMVCLDGGGTPLADRARVAGTTRYELYADQAGQEVDGLLERLRDLPRSDWARELGEDLDRFGEQLEQRGDAARRQLREEVLPKLRRQVDELRRWLRERGREEEAEPLEERLKRLERT